MKIAYIARVVDDADAARLAGHLAALGEHPQLEVYVDHASRPLDGLAEAGIAVSVAVKSYLSLAGSGVLSADAGQARALAASHAEERFDLLVYQHTRCADLSWHEPALTAVPVAVEVTNQDDAPPWQRPFEVQRRGFTQAADVSGPWRAVSGPPPQLVAVEESPMPFQDLRADADHAVVRHDPAFGQEADRIARLTSHRAADLVLAGRRREPLGDADVTRLCHHVVGVGPRMAGVIGEVSSPGVLLEQAVAAGLGVLVVPTHAHGCDVRTSDAPLPPAARAAKDWLTDTPIWLRAAVGLPSRGGLLEAAMYRAAAPMGVRVWARQQPWRIRRLLALPRPLAGRTLEDLW